MRYNINILIRKDLCMGNNYGLTNTEWELMELFWTVNEPLKFSDVTDYCKTVCQQNLAPQTIHTHLANLVKKGVLESGRNGYKRFYYAKYTESELKHRWASNMLVDSFNGSLKELLLAVAPHHKCEQDEIAELHQIIDEAFSEDQ